MRAKALLAFICLLFTTESEAMAAESAAPSSTGATQSTQIQDGWFAESEVMWPGQRFSLEVNKDGAGAGEGAQRGRRARTTARSAGRGAGEQPA